MVDPSIQKPLTLVIESKSGRSNHAKILIDSVHLFKEKKFPENKYRTSVFWD